MFAFIYKTSLWGTVMLCCFSWLILANEVSTKEIKIDNACLRFLPYFQSQERDSVIADTVMIHQLLHQFIASHNDTAIIICENALGIIARETGDNKRAFLLFEQGIQKSEKLQNVGLLMVSYNNFAVVCRRVEKLDEAAQYHMQALKLAEMQSDSTSWLVLKNRCVALNGLGNISLSMQQYSQAMNYFKQAIQIEKRLNSYIGVAINYANMGATFGLLNQPDSALVQYHLAMQYNQKGGSMKGVAISHTCIGEVLMTKTQFNEALLHFKRALVITDSIGDVYHWLAANSDYSKLQILLGRKEEAKHSALQAIEKAQSSGVRFYLSEAFLLLAKISEKENDLAASISYLQKGYDCRDSMVAESNLKHIEDLQMKYETEKKEQQIKWLEQEDRNNHFIRKMLFGLLILLIALVIALWFLARFRKRNVRQQELLLAREQQLSKIMQQQLNLEIELKNRELTLMAVQLASKNEFLNSVKNALTSKGVSQSIVSQIDSGMNLEKDWDSFRTHFEGVHPAFFKRIKELFADITPKEERLCAYLRINMTTKEIAQILNVTVAAVDKSRNRLRKKLNIDSGISLVDFMIEIEN